MGICQLNIQSSNDDLDLRKQIILISKMLVQDFGDVQKNKFEVYIINDKKSVKKFPHWASGIAFKNKIYILRDKLSSTVLSHELCHIYQNKIKNSATFPSWFKEGMAMYFSRDFFNKDVSIISESVLLDYIIEIDQLGSISKLKNEKDIRLAYQESLYAYQKIISDYSSSSIIKILDEMNNNKSFEIAFKNIIGITLDEFSSNIDDEIKKTGLTAIFFNFPSILIFISSIIIMIIFTYIRFRNKKTIKKWEIEEELELLNEDNIDIYNN
tara:strand:- start:1485 stop:2291 length:807 start_codon:yes stop_codon:yes gene_type:complete